MRKNKGFTLIELLGVIVILAVILVIAVPKILDVIERVDKNAYKESVELMAHTAQLQYSTNEIFNNVEKIPNGGIVYTFKDGIQYVTEGYDLLKFKGDTPDSGYITLTKDKKIIVEKLVSKNKKWCASKTISESKVQIDKCDLREINLNVSTTNTTKSIMVTVSPDDLETYYYKINDSEFESSTLNTKEYTELEKNKTYTITVRGCRKKEIVCEEKSVTVSLPDLDIPAYSISSIPEDQEATNGWATSRTVTIDYNQEKVEGTDYTTLINQYIYASTQEELIEKIDNNNWNTCETDSCTLPEFISETHIIARTTDGYNELSNSIITITNFDRENPSAPVITGGSEDWVNTNRTINVSTKSIAASEIKKYQYYVSISSTELTGGSWKDCTTSNLSQKFTDAGIYYIFFRSQSYVGFNIAKNGTCYQEKYDSTGTNSSNLEIKSENGGKVCLEKPTAGTWYKIVETSSLPGYSNVSYKGEKSEQFLMIDVNGNVYKGGGSGTSTTLPAVLTNDNIKIKFYKEDSETGKRINKAGFTVYKNNTVVKFNARDSRGCYKENATGTVTEVYTDTNVNNGEVCLSYVTSGSTYKVVETTVPTGYRKMPDKEIVAKKNTDAVNLTNEVLKETPLYMYFTKEDKDKKTPIIGAEFEIYKGNNLVKFSQKTGEDCYIEDTNGSVTKLYSKNITIKSTNEDGSITNVPVSGGVCLKYVSADTMYKVKETNPVDGYTFFKPTGEESAIKIKVNKLGVQTNYNLNETSRENSKMVNYPTMLEFEKKASDDGESKDSTITQLIDGALFEIVNDLGQTMTFVEKGNGLYEYSASGTITKVHTTNRKFTIKYLPWGNYNVKEVEESAPNGYYYNADSSKFTITKYTNGQVEKMDSAKTNIIDKPVEITFTKTDIYSYYSAEDKAKIDSEEKLLDTAKFVIKDSNGNILKLKYIGQTEEDGNIYRYLPVDSNNTKEKINTYKGKLKITHLMNNTKYVIEEVESMEGFILPENHPKKEYNIKRKEPSSKTDSSITQVIENTPARVRIEKKDLKTGYLIDDEKVTFELYKVEETGKLTRIYVDKRKWLADAKGNLEYAYTYSKLNKKTTERITTYGGVIVIRYLPKGKYVLKEIEAPKGYDLPVGEGAKTYFEVSGSTVEVDAEVIENKPSKIIIRKYSEEGYLITGARFKIYRVRNYDPNLSAKNQEKELIKLKTIRQGEYENKEVRDTEEITTCEENCEIIGTETKEAGIIKSGELIVQYLETENYYVIEEVKAPEGYQLPENPYSIVYLKESVEDVDAEVVIENEYTPITFYKYDEYNKLLDGAEYKLQKLNNNKKYEDINVSKMEEKEGSVYAVDYNSETSTITTTNGSATIYMLAPGQYRVLEVKAPEGYELPKASVNVATFFVTDEGKTKGDFIISNKKPTTTKTILNSATSELVINIQTGQKVMKYIGIIIGLLTGIGILMFIIHKMNKKA